MVCDFRGLPAPIATALQDKTLCDTCTEANIRRAVFEVVYHSKERGACNPVEELHLAFVRERDSKGV